MGGLRLLEEVEAAARNFSLNENTDVAISRADGSTTVYINGQDATPPWLAGPTPEKMQGQPVTYANLTPTQVQLGHWHEELEQFIPSGTMTVEEFLSLHRSAK